MSEFTEATWRWIPGALRAGRPEGEIVGPAGDGFRFWIGRPDSGCSIQVPEGFRTDGASIPQWFLRLLPRRIRKWLLGQLLKASALHDRLREDLRFELVDSDCLFLLAMHVEGTHPMVRFAAYHLVRTNRSRTQHNAAA